MHDCKKGLSQLDVYSLQLLCKVIGDPGLVYQSSTVDIIWLNYQRHCVKKPGCIQFKYTCRPNNMCKHTSNFRPGFDW